MTTLGIKENIFVSTKHFTPFFQLRSCPPQQQQWQQQQVPCSALSLRLISFCQGGSSSMMSDPTICLVGTDQRDDRSRGRWNYTTALFHFWLTDKVQLKDLFYCVVLQGHPAKRSTIVSRPRLRQIKYHNRVNKLHYCNFLEQVPMLLIHWTGYS